MTILPSKYDVNAPENRGWLALYLTIITDLSGDEALRCMGVKPLIEESLKEVV